MEPKTVLRCPVCGLTRLFKDGLRYTTLGQTQRFCVVVVDDVFVVGII